MNASLHIDLNDDVDDKKFFKRQFVVCIRWDKLHSKKNYNKMKMLMINFMGASKVN